jgi:hypothetical protein
MGLSSLADDCALPPGLNEARQALDVAQHLRPANGCATSANWACCACCKVLSTAR